MGFRDRLTYRLVALIVVLGFTLLWVLGRDVQVGDTTFHPDAIAALLVALGAVGLYMFPQSSTWVDKPIFGAGKGISKPAEKDPIKANREALLEAVDQTWLSGLLDHLLNQQESLKIGLEALEPDKLAKKMGGQPYPLTDNQAALKAFEDFGQRLVVLGEPGAGKTVLMLQLARLLWTRAKQDEKQRIPIVFPLASWAAKQLPFHEWLQSELHNRYGTPEKLAKALVESEQVIFLLDGLDEVAEAQREDCLKTLKAFVEDKNRDVEYVLCSRRKEFEALQTRLDVPGEIVLQPLTKAQINDYLKREPFAALRGLVETNDIIRNEFATIPFMLNTMAYVTRGKSAEALKLMLAGKDSEESLRAAFLEEYVTQRLAEKPNESYSNANTRHWLRWLAGQLIKHDETDFYLENMQPDWLRNKTQERHWRPVVTLVIVLMGGLTGGLGSVPAGDRSNWWASGLVIELLFGLMGGTMSWWVGGLVGEWADKADGQAGKEITFSKKRIKMNDRFRWSFSREKLILGLLMGVILEMLLESVVGPLRALVVLVIGLMIGLMGGLKSQSMLRYRIKPGQGIQRSLANSLLIALVFGLALEQMTVTTALPMMGMMFAPLVGLIFGLDAFIGHYVLRWMLAKEDVLPFYRYDKFLDYGHELVILRKVGGGYRFVHDMLRQHLAATMTE